MTFLARASQRHVPSVNRVLGALRHSSSTAPRLRQFFDHNHFWSERSNVGPLVLGIVSIPFVFRMCRNMYWHYRFDKLNTQEILNDRMEWLWHRLLEDEIEAACVAKEAV